MQKPTVDVIIPTYKPQKRLLKVIEALENQSYPVNQIIIMNTEEKYWNTFLYGEKIVNARDNVTVRHLSKMEFDHAGTRKRAIKRSKADYFICMTDDAMPADEFLIEELLKPMLEKKAEFSYARQLPYEDCGVIERFTREFNYPAESCIKSKDDLERLQIKTYFFSNVCAAYTRSLYDSLGGFVDSAIFNEDMYFAATAIQAGYRICYAADAKVYHSHNYKNRMQFKRNFDNGVSQAMKPEFFEGISSTGEGKKLVKLTIEYLKEQKKKRYIPKLIISSAYKYMGYKLGINYKRLSQDFVLKCTLNQEFWMRQSIRTATQNIDPNRGYGMSADERK